MCIRDSLESVEQENDVLKVENRDLKRLKMALGEEKVISILEHQKAAELPDNKLKCRNGMEDVYKRQAVARSEFQRSEAVLRPGGGPVPGYPLFKGKVLQ